MRSPLVFVAVVVGLLATSCAFDPVVGVNARIRCSADGDCPDGRVCFASAGECLPPGTDLVPPDLAGPASLNGETFNGQDVLTVTFSATEPLGVDPVVAVSGVLMKRDDGVGSGPWTYSLALADTGIDGIAQIDIGLEDVAHNTSSRSGGAVFIDAVPPQIVDVALTPPSAVQGDVVSVDVVTDESVDPPGLEWNGTALDMVARDAGFAEHHSLDHRVSPASPSGTFTLASVVVRDALGNETRVTLADLTSITGGGEPQVTIDATACGPGLHDGGDLVCTDAGACALGFHDGGAGACVAIGVCGLGFHDDGGGGCAPAGTCGAAYHDGGDGSCIPLTQCDADFHDDGTGACVAAGECNALAGMHDGGDGSCVDASVCRVGFHDGGLGACVVLGACEDGFHDDGASRCVLEGLCGDAYHDGGAGDCTPFNRCSDGFHDGGDSACVATGCSAGFHDGGAGADICVSEGQCSLGFHDGGDGACVLIGTCSGTFHDGGAGECLAPPACSPGFHDGGSGDCIDSTRCDLSFHDDGSGACAPLGTCATGFHDGGDGRCVDQSVCSTGFHDGGTGACTLLGTCADGRHNAGDGTCSLLGTCTGGFHDGGTGTCVLRGSCTVGFHDGGDAAGTCVATGTCVDGFHNGGDGSCVHVGQCQLAFHDGGDGRCVILTACSTGFHDGGDGSCRLSGCSTGFHDGGDARCRVLGSCSVGFHDGGDGVCVLADTCSPDFRDDGRHVGACVPLTFGCARGFRDDGTGECVSDTSPCADTFHDGGDGDCVLISLGCSPGFHDDGLDHCVSDAACADGFHDGGDGDCIATGSCATGFTLQTLTGICQLAPPVVSPLPMPSACDQEVTGWVHGDGSPLHVSLEPSATGAFFDCRAAAAGASRGDFVPCDAADPTNPSAVLTPPQGQQEGSFVLEVRARVVYTTGLAGTVVEKSSRSTFFNFYVHHSLDGVQCCGSPVSDAVWLQRAASALSNIPRTPFTSVSLKKPFLSVRTSVDDFAPRSLRHSFATNAQRDILLVRRNAESRFAQEHGVPGDRCTGLSVYVPTETPVTPCNGVFHVSNGTQSICTPLGSCRQISWQFHSGEPNQLTVPGPLICPELKEATPTFCHAYAVTSAGDGVCFGSDGAVLALVQAHGAAKEGLRVTFGRSDNSKRKVFSKKGENTGLVLPP